MVNRRAGSPPTRTATVIAIVMLAGTLGAGRAAAATQVIQDPAAFSAIGGVEDVPFPADADTALPSRPFSGLTGYSCTDAAAGIDLGVVTVSAPSADRWLCYFDADFNAPAGNIVPRPVSTTIVANGEDDYLLTFPSPVYAVGLGILTNSVAQERITVTAPDGSTTVLEDDVLGTEPNAFEFVGLVSLEGISSVAVDTTGGRLQNTGITSISVLRTPPATQVAVAVDIKPGDDRNCVNPRARGVVPVAVLTDDGFDARSIDPRTVALEGAPARPRGRSGHVGILKDVDGDGDLDLLVHIDDPGVLAGKSEAVLTATTWDGTAVEGSDHVCTVGSARRR